MFNPSEHETAILREFSPMGRLTKLVALRDSIDSILADKPSRVVEDNLYWTRQMIVACIREEAAHLPHTAVA
jgi:hypothetical protein